MNARTFLQVLAGKKVKAVSCALTVQTSAGCHFFCMMGCHLAAEERLSCCFIR